MPVNETLGCHRPAADQLSRRALLRLVVPVWAAGVVGAASATPSRTRTGLKIALPRTASVAGLPLQLAGDLGYLDAEGLDVQWVSVPSDVAAAQALAAGRVQAAAIEYTQVLAQRARGVELCAVVQQTRAPLRVLAVQPRATAGLAKAGVELRGRRLGVPPDLACQLIIERTLQVAGLGGADLSVLPLADPQEVLEQYRQGSIDALCLDATLVSGLELRGEVKLVADTRTVRGTTEVLGGAVPGLAVCVQRHSLSHQEAVCQALAHAVVRALKWLRTAGPSDLARVLPESAMGADRAQYLAAFEKSRDGLSTDGLMPDAAAASALLAMLRLDTSLTRLHPVLAETYTNEYALKAKQRFRA